jgi:osmoprotectant transport system substrate-binding protein
MRFLVSFLTLTLLSACVSIGPQRKRLSVPERDPSILIGAFNFSESRVLAEVYRQALQEQSFDVEVLSDVGPREIIEPALEQAQIDVAVEYMGAALAFLDPEAVEGATGAAQTFSRLQEALAERGVRALEPAPGQNRNEIVVTQRTAEEHGLRTVSDLQKIDSEVVFGGPSECPARPLCLEGLEGTYQLEFEGFVPLDSGGPKTVAALESGEIDAALLFTTNPAITQGRLVALEDDRGLQPPENIIPVIREEVIGDQDPAFVEAFDSVTRLLTNDELRKLNAAVDIRHESPEDAASRWLAEQGIT